MSVIIPVLILIAVVFICCLLFGVAANTSSKATCDANLEAIPWVLLIGIVIALIAALA